MTSVRVLGLLLCVALPAYGAQRTFVASTGNDASACTLAQPCRTFAAALAATDGGGEIVALDSAGYGSVTVDRSISIVAARGAYVGIGASAGDAVAIGVPRLQVTLRGLTLNNTGTAIRGVAVTAASRVTIEECVIASFAGDGVDLRADGAAVRIAHSTLHGHGNRGVSASGSSTLDVDDVRIHDVHGPGLHVERGIRATVARASITANRRGVTVFGNAAGVETRVAMVDSVVAGNLFSGVWVRSLVAGGTASVQATGLRINGNGEEGVRASAVDGAAGIASVEASVVSGNGSGVVNEGSAATTIVVSSSTIAGNAGFGLRQAGGTLASRVNNAVHDNNGGGAQTSGSIASLGAK